jgi:hypothetical protein
LTRAHAAALHLGHVPEIELSTPDPAELTTLVAATLEEPIADPACVTQLPVCAAAGLRGAAAIGGHGAASLSTGDAPLVLWTRRRRRDIYTREFLRDVRDAASAAPPASAVSWLRSRISDVWMPMRESTVLADSTLALTRAAAAAAGLRLIMPFASAPVLELATGRCSSDRHASRPLLQRLLQRHLPPALVPATTASLVPQWLRRAVTRFVPPILLADRFDARGIISRTALSVVWDEHRSGRYDHSLRFWSMLVLELWFRQVIDGDAVAEPEPVASWKVA